MKKILLHPYNPDWKKQFEAEAHMLKKIMGDVCVDIHHVGSTSVPGLISKPKIDIIMEVSDLFFDHKLLTDLGYIDRGGFNLPLRRTFNIKGKVNIHVFEKGDPEVELNLKIRDHLRNNEHDRKAYGALKQELVTQDACHEKIGGLRIYTFKKNAFIQNLLKKIGYKRIRFVFGMHFEEQEMINALRKKYCHDISPITSWHDPAHKHCILYQGVQAVGYAHVHLMDHKRVSIITFVIAESKRKQGLGKVWIHLIEKWLRLKNYPAITVTSEDKAAPFFKKVGFASSSSSHLQKTLLPRKCI